MSLSRPFLSVDHEAYTQPGADKKKRDGPQRNQIFGPRSLLRILITEHRFLLRLFGHEGWIPE